MKSRLSRGVGGAGLVAAMLLTAGCSSIDSESVTTAGIYAQYRAVAEDDASVRVSATLKAGSAGSNTLITLATGEYLEVVGDGQSAQLGAVAGLFGGTSYSATLGVGATSNLALVLALVRNAQPRIDTAFSLPPRFDILAPAADSHYSIGAGALLTLSWAPVSAEPMRIEAQSHCPGGHTDYFDITLNLDSGSHTLAVRDLVADLLADPLIDPAALDCDVTLTLSRVRTSAVADAFAGGKAEGMVERSLQVVLTP